MSTGWNVDDSVALFAFIINLLGNEYWLEPYRAKQRIGVYYKPTGK